MSFFSSDMACYDYLEVTSWSCFGKLSSFVPHTLTNVFSVGLLGLFSPKYETQSFDCQLDFKSNSTAVAIVTKVHSLFLALNCKFNK